MKPQRNILCDTLNPSSQELTMTEMSKTRKTLLVVTIIVAFFVFITRTLFRRFMHKISKRIAFALEITVGPGSSD
uniref:Uncharacterized protein n=1 Tax=Candidozyma auris TaxID=498019 RepID=A0A0L0NSU4_CANAR